MRKEIGTMGKNDTIANKLMLALLGLMMSVIAVSAICTEGSQVMAATLEEAYNDATYKDFLTVEHTKTTAIEKIGAKTAPAQPTTTACKDWLFAGWYSDVACTTPIRTAGEATEPSYAKFVPTDVLSVKCQVLADTDENFTSTNLRFTTSIDTDQYYRVGFEISRPGKTYAPYETSDAFKRIEASEEAGVAFKYSPKVINTKSEGFVTYTITGIPNTEENRYFDTVFMAKPYWKTLDGTKVYGVTRYVKVSDFYNGVVNIPVKVEKADSYTNSDFTVTKYTNATTVAGDVTEGVAVRYNAQENYATISLSGQGTLASATKYTVSHEGDTTTYIQRNLLTKYSGSGTADRSWYDVDNSANEFVIATSADLYGFAGVANGDNQTFALKKIYLVADIVVNKGKPTSTGWDTTGIEGGTNYAWIPVGNGSARIFGGTFDGQGHTISGLRQTGTLRIALFGWASTSSVIQNFRLTNSYFESTTEGLGGSIAGRSDGLIQDVYSDAVVKCAAQYAGGIVGYGQSSSKITNCQYAGTIYASGDSVNRVGGIIGHQTNGTATNCLFSGKIEIVDKTTTTVSEMNIGGIYGYAQGTVTITNCLSVGEISKGNCTLTLKTMGHVIGLVHKSATINVTNLYYVNKSKDVTLAYSGIGTISNKAEIKNIDEADITGLGPHYNNILVNTTDSAWVPTAATPELKIFAQAPMTVNEPEDINLDWYTGIATNYTICNETDTTDVKIAKLKGFAYLVGVGVTFDGKTVYLGADVDLNQGWTASAALPTGGNTWTPIGTTEYEFAGIFDGGMHSISGVYIKENQQGVGLFRSTAVGSTIKNLRLINSYVESTSTTSWVCVGSIVGSCAGSLENVYSDANVKTIKNANGGLVGELWSNQDVSVKQCWFDGTMDVKGNSGGIIGMFNGTGCKLTMENCLNTGTINANNTNTIGGLIGRTYPGKAPWVADGGTKSSVDINNCLNYGDLQNVGTQVGSIIGYVQKSTATLTSVYMTEESSQTDIGAVHATNGTRSGEANAMPKTSITGGEATHNEFPLLNAGWVATTNTAPVPEVFADYVAAITTAWYDGSSSPYKLTTAAQLRGFSHLVSTGTDFDGEIVELGNDVNLSPNWTASKEGRPGIAWSPIGNETNKFAGTFDGNGYTISGIYVDGEVKHMGFFGVTASGSTITDFKIDNSYFNQRIAGNSSKGFTASVAGQLCGSMSNVYSNAIIKSGNARIGGLVAFVNTQASDSSNITNCWFDGTIIGSTGGWYIGGIASTVQGGNCNIENVLFSGQIESDYVVPEGATGSRKAVHIGGIVSDVVANNTTLSLESVVSAGSIINRTNHGYVNAVVARMRDAEDATTAESTLMMRNVFATRDCAETVYGRDGKATVNGTVVRTTGADRLIGLATFEEKNADDSACVLDFTQWKLRKDNVPIPACFSTMDTVKKTVVAEFTNESLAKEIGLDYWDETTPDITDPISYGAGNYLVSYEGATKAQYDEYLAMLMAKVGTQTAEDHDGLGFSKCITNEKTAMMNDGVYASTCYKEATAESGEWVLNITYVAKEERPRIYIAVNTDVKSVAPTLKVNNQLANPSETGTSPISLSMLEMVNTHDGDKPYGNSFVFQLPNGHFIVSDGGRAEDGQKLIEFLRDQAGEGKDVIIDAWIISHYHDDHCGALNLFFGASSWRENIYLEAIYACEPSSYALEYLSTDQQLGVVNNALRGARALTKNSDGTKPDVYQLHMGQRYYFYGLTMDVIDTQEQRHVSTWGSKNVPDAFNTSSTNCVFTFKDKADNTKKVLIGGDATTVNMEYIMGAYGEGNQTLSNINVFAAYHHGHNTTALYEEGADRLFYYYKGKANDTWANFLLDNNGGQFDIVFFPYYKVYEMYEDFGNHYAGDDGLKEYPYNIGTINDYLCKNATAYYSYGYDDCLTEYTESNLHGTVKITFDGSNTATVFGQGIFTTTIK